MRATKSSAYPTFPILPPATRATDLIVALDPGQNFGAATYHPFPAVPAKNFDFETHKFGRNGHAQVELLLVHLHGARTQAQLATAELGLDDVEVRTFLVIEKFEFRKDDQTRDKIDYTPAEYVGVARLIGEQLFDHVILQGASEAKQFWDDEKLRKLNLYQDTKHSRDAMRHLLKFMTFNSWMRQKWLLAALKGR